MPKVNLKRGFDRIYLVFTALAFLFAIFYPVYFGMESAERMYSLDQQIATENYVRTGDAKARDAAFERRWQAKQDHISLSWNSVVNPAYLAQRLATTAVLLAIFYLIIYSFGRLVGWLISGFKADA
jgi:hypothetical protein